MKTTLKTAIAASVLSLATAANAAPIIVNGSSGGDYSNGSVTLSAGGIGAHDSLSISFDLYILDSWDGGPASHCCAGPDEFGFRVNGVEIFAASFNNFHPNTVYETNTDVADVVGNFNSITTWQNNGPDRLFFNYNGGFNMAHTDNYLDLEFFGRGLQGLRDESWRVTNVNVDSNTAQVSEPGSLALVGLGLLGLGAVRRRMSK